MELKGRMTWISADIIEALYKDRDSRATISEALRDYMGLDLPRKDIIAKQSMNNIDISNLKVGEAKSFQNVSLDAVQKAVGRQIKDTGRRVTLNATQSSIQVIRIE